VCDACASFPAPGQRVEALRVYRVEGPRDAMSTLTPTRLGSGPAVQSVPIALRFLYSSRTSCKYN